MQDTQPREQAVLFLKEGDLSLMDERDVIADFLQIARNVGGNEDGMGVVLHKIIEDIQNFVSDDRVEAAGRLVEQQQAAVVGQRAGNGQLHLHAARVVLDRLFAGQVKAGKVVLESLVRPGAEGGRQDAANVAGAQITREMAAVEDHADVLKIAAAVLAKDLHAAAVGHEQTQNQFDCGGLSCAVLPNEADHAAGRNGQVERPEGKGGITLGNVV